jgi:23S rRNA (adenine2503-C2)-methyltransferase
MGFARNLTAGEIIDQVLQTQRRTDRRISNVVFMGMGEPMLNYENVMKAIELLQDDHSLNIGIRHMTISTAGYADQIRRLADEDRNIKLALSLHTLNNELRLKLMPVTRKYSVEELLQALEYYYRRTRYRPTLEYILFDGLNDTEEDARALIEVGKRLPCKVNLIPYHAVDFARPAAAAGLTLRPSPPERIASFAAALRTGLMTVMVRNSSGNDIHAACGQLAVQHPSADKP